MLASSLVWSTPALKTSPGGVVSYAMYGNGHRESKRYQSHRILRLCARACMYRILPTPYSSSAGYCPHPLAPLQPSILREISFPPREGTSATSETQAVHRYTMPRPTSSAFSKSVDGRQNPGSPRWGGVHGSGSNQGQSSDITSRRGVTPVSSPRSHPPPPGSGSSRGSSARDQHGLRGTITEISGRNSSGSAGSRGRKSIESDCGGGAREDGGEGSGRIRVAVRVRALST